MSGPARSKRLARELQECLKDDSVKVSQVDNKIDHFIGEFAGPTGTSYQGGWFKVDVVAPERYPFEPLKMKFITKVYHPNISSASGYICLDILTATSWSPVFTLRTCLVSLQSLLSTPEPNDPQDAQVAKHYLTDRKGFEETAKFWTEVYAAPPSESKSPLPLSDSSPEPANPSKRPRLRESHRTSSDGVLEVIDPLKEVRKEAESSRIDWRDVEMFKEMGFEPDKVVRVLKRLNFRGGNKDKVGVEGVVGALVGGDEEEGEE